MVETTEGAGENRFAISASPAFLFILQLRLVTKNRPADESNEKSLEMVEYRRFELLTSSMP